MSDGNLLEGASLIPRILSLFKPFGFSFSVRSLFVLENGRWRRRQESILSERRPRKADAVQVSALVGCSHTVFRWAREPNSFFHFRIAFFARLASRIHFLGASSTCRRWIKNSKDLSVSIGR